MCIIMCAARHSSVHEHGVNPDSFALCATNSPSTLPIKLIVGDQSRAVWLRSSTGALILVPRLIRSSDQVLDGLSSSLI